MTKWVVGDIANDHVLGEDLVWRPLPTAVFDEPCMLCPPLGDGVFGRMRVLQPEGAALTALWTAADPAPDGRFPNFQRPAAVFATASPGQIPLMPPGIPSRILKAAISFSDGWYLLFGDPRAAKSFVKACR